MWRHSVDDIVELLISAAGAKSTAVALLLCCSTSVLSLFFVRHTSLDSAVDDVVAGAELATVLDVGLLLAELTDIWA